MKDLDGDGVEAEENGETSSSTSTVLLNQDNRIVHQFIFWWSFRAGNCITMGIILDKKVQFNF